jgi:hypothetical protein
MLRPKPSPGWRPRRHPTHLTRKGAISGPLRILRRQNSPHYSSRWQYVAYHLQTPMKRAYISCRELQGVARGGNKKFPRRFPKTGEVKWTGSNGTTS